MDVFSRVWHRLAWCASPPSRGASSASTVVHSRAVVRVKSLLPCAKVCLSTSLPIPIINLQKTGVNHQHLTRIMHHPVADGGHARRDESTPGAAPAARSTARTCGARWTLDSRSATRDAPTPAVRSAIREARSITKRSLLRYAMIGTPRAIDRAQPCARDNAALHGHTPHAAEDPRPKAHSTRRASNANGDAESWILAEWACTRTSMRPDMVSHPHVREAGTPHTPLHHGTATRAQPSPHLPLLFPKVRLGPQVVACPLPSTLPAAFATNEKASMAPRAPGDVYS